MKHLPVKIFVALICDLAVACCSVVAADRSVQPPLKGTVANTQGFFQSDSDSGKKVTGLALKPDGSTLYCSSCEDVGTVSVIDTKTDHVVAVIDVGKSPLALALDATNGRLYCINTASADVSVIDTAKNQLIATIPVAQNSSLLAVDDKKGRLYVGNSKACTISVIDCSNRAVVQTFDIRQIFPNTLFLSDMLLSPDGERLYLSTEKSQTQQPMLYEVVDSITASNGRRLASLPLPQWASRASLFLSNDGRSLYLTSIFQHLFLSMNADLSSAPRQSSIGELPGFMACSPDGQWIFVCDCLNNTLMFVDAKNGKVAHTVPLGKGPLQCVMTKDGHYLWLGYIHRPYATCVDLLARKLVADVHNELVR